VATPEQLRAAGSRIARPILAERLNRALDRGALLLLAGAGCGKTVALEEALAARDARSAWLRCTPADTDAGRLLRRLVQALSEATPGAVDLLAERLAMAQERIDARALGQELVAELDRLLLDQLVIVIDDAEHLAHDGDSAALVGDLLGADSAVLRVAVATRTALPLRLAKLRTGGRLTEIGAEELAFSPDECGELLRSLRRSDADAERLFAATEGWPLGSSLGALSADIPSLRGAASRTRLFDFLREEVLDPLDPELRASVIDSSITPELDQGCMLALGLPGDFPERVAQAGLPLRPAGGEGDWLAYHPLVREFLLERLDLEREHHARRNLHTRVAPALTEAGRVEEAIEHWLAAESWSDAHAAITVAAPPLLNTAPATVQRWIDSLPDQLRDGSWCLLLQGALDWAEGRQPDAVARLRESARLFTEAGDPVGTWLARFTLADPLFVSGDIEGVVELADGFDAAPALAAGATPPAVAAYAAAALGGLGRVGECEELSRRLLAHPHADPVRPLHLVWKCYEHLLAGGFDRLVPGAENAIREFERVDPFDRLPVIAGILAIALGDQGHDAEALSRWRRVEELARERHSRAMLKVSLVWQALLHARAGAAGPAQQLLARADDSTGVGWREYAVELARARVATLRGDPGAAVSACGRGLTLAAQAPLSERFQAVVDAAPVLFDAGLSARSRALVEDALADCDARVPGAPGRYSRALLLGLRAWLRDAEGDAAGAAADLEAIWTDAGASAPDVVRREWGLLERPLWRALAAGTLDPGAVIAAIEVAWPGGDALLAFTSHPNSRVRRAAVAPAGVSGHPDLPSRLDELAADPDPEVAAAAVSARERLVTRPPPLDFTLLGGFEVRRGSWNADDSAWDRRVAQRLVRFLLVKRGSAVSEDLLLEAFWPDTPEPSARRSLRVAVSCARNVLDVPDTPSVIEGSERTLALRLRERDSVDADRFEQAARAALGADGPERRSLLERAVGLWAGEPLPEERYADWAAAWRESLTVRYAEVLAALVAACHEDDDQLAATQAARRLVELEPLDESAQRELITAYARSGRRAHALRQFLECRRRLVDELGMEPAAQTVELQRRVLAGEPV
jgi:DNA-binding SARP family transcriptional activator/tetratricopeptide (TPR) repeat protein